MLKNTIIVHAKLTNTMQGCCYAVARVFLVIFTRCIGFEVVFFSVGGLIRSQSISSISSREGFSSRRFRVENRLCVSRLVL